MTAPDLAIIVPHYNDTVRLTRLLTALVPQLSPSEELIVVDNASTEDLSPVRAAFPDLMIASQPRPGAAEARNMGVARTTAPHLAFLDADCVPAGSWVTEARKIVRAQGDAITGGRVDVFDETPPPRSGAEAFETVFAFDQEGYIRDKGFTVTANVVTTRAVFAAVGPFHHGVSEDIDWSNRAVAAGIPLHYAPDLSVSHPTRQDWPALERKWRRLSRELWGLKATEGHHGLRARVIWAARGAIAQPASILAYAPRVLRHPALTGPEKRAALTTMARLYLKRSGWMLRQAVTR